MITIDWSDLSLESLAEIVLWYDEQVNPAFADSVKQQISKQVQLYTKEPLTPSSLPNSEFYPGTRKLFVRDFPYVVIIRHVKRERWEVVDVIHTSRKLPKGQ
jgi:plasmid stabilization system protein ParE